MAHNKDFNFNLDLSGTHESPVDKQLLLDHARNQIEKVANTYHKDFPEYMQAKILTVYPTNLFDLASLDETKIWYNVPSIIPGASQYLQPQQVVQCRFYSVDSSRPYIRNGMGMSSSVTDLTPVIIFPYARGLWTQGQAEPGLTCMGNGRMHPWLADRGAFSPNYPEALGFNDGYNPPLGWVAFERQSDNQSCFVMLYASCVDGSMGVNLLLRLTCYLHADFSVIWDVLVPESTYGNPASNPPFNSVGNRWNFLFYDKTLRSLCVIGHGNSTMMSKRWIFLETGSLLDFVVAPFRLEQCSFAMNLLVRGYHSRRSPTHRLIDDPYLRGVFFNNIQNQNTFWQWDPQSALLGYQIATSSGPVFAGTIVGDTQGSFYTPEGRWPICAVDTQTVITCVYVGGSLKPDSSINTNIACIENSDIPGNPGILGTTVPDDSCTFAHSASVTGVNINGSQAWEWRKNFTPVHQIDTNSVTARETGASLGGHVFSYTFNVHGPQGVGTSYDIYNYVGFAGQHSIIVGDSGTFTETFVGGATQETFRTGCAVDVNSPAHEYVSYSVVNAQAQHIYLTGDTFKGGYDLRAGGVFPLPSNFNPGRAISYPVYDVFFPGHPRLFPLPTPDHSGDNLGKQWEDTGGGDSGFDGNPQLQIFWPRTGNFPPAGGGYVPFDEYVRFDPVGGTMVVDSLNHLWFAFLHQDNPIVMGSIRAQPIWQSRQIYVENYGPNAIYDYNPDGSIIGQCGTVSSRIQRDGFTFGVYQIGKVTVGAKSKIVCLNAKTGEELAYTDIGQDFDYRLNSASPSSLSSFKRTSIDQIYQIIPLPEISRLIIVRDLRDALYDDTHTLSTLPYRAVEVRDYNSPGTVLSTHKFNDQQLFDAANPTYDPTSPTDPVFNPLTIKKRIINTYQGDYNLARGDHDPSGIPWVLFQFYVRNQQTNVTKTLRAQMYFNNGGAAPSWTVHLTDVYGETANPEADNEFNSLAFTGADASFITTNQVAQGGQNVFIGRVRSNQ